MNGNGKHEVMPQLPTLTEQLWVKTGTEQTLMLTYPFALFVGYRYDQSPKKLVMIT